MQKVEEVVTVQQEPLPQKIEEVNEFDFDDNDLARDENGDVLIYQDNQED